MSSASGSDHTCTDDGIEKLLKRLEDWANRDNSIVLPVRLPVKPICVVLVLSGDREELDDMISRFKSYAEDQGVKILEVEGRDHR